MRMEGEQRAAISARTCSVCLRSQDVLHSVLKKKGVVMEPGLLLYMSIGIANFIRVGENPPSKDKKGSNAISLHGP